MIKERDAAGGGGSVEKKSDFKSYDRNILKIALRIHDLTSFLI